MKTMTDKIPDRCPTPVYYVASRASIPERGAMWRALRSGGVNIVSSWIDECGNGQTASFEDLWARIEREIRSATALILYVEAGDFPLKGALVEVGMAIAMGKPVLVFAPGVEINQRDLKPLGSWAKHPAATLMKSSLQQFLLDATWHKAAPQAPGQPQTPLDVPLAERDKGELLTILGHYREELQWYVDERNRLRSENERIKIERDAARDSQRQVVTSLVRAEARLQEMERVLRKMVDNANWKKIPASEEEFDAMIAEAERVLAGTSEERFVRKM
jgi:hypothetical protein